MENGRRKFFKGIAGAGVFAALPLARGNTGDYSKIKTIAECDICVLGGSCTGVFAAVRAARMDAKVVIAERQNGFGGVASNALVNVWHTLLDCEFKKEIIAGLTLEVIERLKKRDAVKTSSKNQSVGFVLNTMELKTELDELVLESKVKPYLHTLFSEPFFENGKLAGVIVDNKSGRGIIRASYFIDATGDADLCRRMSLETYKYSQVQPPTTCAHISGFNLKSYNEMRAKHREELDIPRGFTWGNKLNSAGDVWMLNGTRVLDRDMSDADDLTFAEMEGRRQVRVVMDKYRQYVNKDAALITLPSCIGIRDSVHVKCLHRIKEDETMNGAHYDDAIANGSYRLDLHHQDKPGLTFYYLDGSAVYLSQINPPEEFRWRQEIAVNPTFYQVPLRALIPQNSENVITAGRMLDADVLSFSGIRVMVNMNQLGEAAGVTCVLTLSKKCAIKDVPASEVRATLAKGGSIII